MSSRRRSMRRRFGKDLSSQILVPYPVESALSGVMKRTDRIWYRRMFSVPKILGRQAGPSAFRRGGLGIGGLRERRPVGTHRGGYDPFSFDITAALKPAGEQEIVVGVYDPSDAGDQPRGKQVQKPGGIWYTPCTGIWQTVWCEPVPADRGQGPAHRNGEGCSLIHGDR